MKGGVMERPDIERFRWSANELCDYALLLEDAVREAIAYRGLMRTTWYWLSLIQRTLFCRVVAQLGLLVVFWLSLAGPSSRQGFGYKVWQNYKAQATFAVPATEGIGVLNKPVSPQDTFLIPELLEPFWSRVRKDRNGRFMAIAGFQWSVSEFAKPKTEFAQVGFVDGDDRERNSDWLVLFSLTCLCCSFVLGVLGLDRIGHHRRIGWCIILISAILLLFGYGSVYFGFPWRWRL